MRYPVIAYNLVLPRMYILVRMALAEAKTEARIWPPNRLLRGPESSPLNRRHFGPPIAASISRLTGPIVIRYWECLQLYDSCIAFHLQPVSNLVYLIGTMFP